MSQLLFIRHGQASLFADDYDKLSPIGEAQARKLGEHWVKQQVRFDAVYSGTLQRQFKTATIVGEIYHQAGLLWPQVETLAGFNEYNGDAIVEKFVPLAAENDATIQRLVADYERSIGMPERSRHFQRLFEAVTQRWVAGDLAHEEVESWRVFHERVRAAIAQITQKAGSGSRLAVFTSGGPTAVAVQLAVRAPEAAALDFNWRLRNCSLTEIVFSRERFTLDVFNAIPHLDDPMMWTYR